MFNLQIKGQLYPSLIDSGASHSIINYDVIKNLSIPIRQEKFIVNTCTGSSNSNVVGTAKLQFILIDTLDQPYVFWHRFLVLKNTNNFYAMLEAMY